MKEFYYLCHIFEQKLLMYNHIDIRKRYYE